MLFGPFSSMSRSRQAGLHSHQRYNHHIGIGLRLTTCSYAAGGEAAGQYDLRVGPRWKGRKLVFRGTGYTRSLKDGGHRRTVLLFC
jgi:hypothetical protein